MSDYNAIDTTRRLEGRGFTRDQAETLAQLLADLWGSIVTRQVLRAELAATREDLGHDTATLRQDLGRDIATLRQDLGRDMATLRQDLGRDTTTLREELATLRADLTRDIGIAVRDLEQSLTIRLGRMLAWAFVTMTGAVGVFLAAATLIIHYWR